MKYCKKPNNNCIYQRLLAINAAQCKYGEPCKFELYEDETPSEHFIIKKIPSNAISLLQVEED
jgi:hypothetical protein